MTRASRCLAVARSLRSPFALASLGLVLYTLVGLRYAIAGTNSDYWEHLAAIKALAAAPLHPSNPFLAGAIPTHLFTPYHLFWALVSLVAGVDPFVLTPLIGAANMVLAVAAVRIVARDLLGRRDLSFPLLFVLLFFWIRPWGYSGVYDFGQLPLTSTYPYWFAFPLALISLSRAGQERFGRGVRGALWSAGVALTVLAHPITGAFLTISIGLKLWTAESLRGRPRGRWVLLALAGVGTALLWPYYPAGVGLTALPSLQALGFGGRYEVFYQRAFLRALPALLGLAYVVSPSRRRRRDLVTAGCLVFGSLYLLNLVAFRSNVLSRSIIYATFYLQVGTVLLMGDARNNPSRRVFQTVFWLLAVPCALLGVTSSVRTLSLSHPARVVYDQFHRYAAHLEPDAVVLAPLEESLLLPATTGTKVVGLRHGSPFVTDYARRRDDTLAFFDCRSSDLVRRDVIARYHARYVMVPRDLCVNAYLEADGLVEVFEDEDYVLWQVR